MIVSSRIVGYDAAFGFDERAFAHHRVGRLRKPEIAQFVQDWYRARIENERERDENAADLIRVLTEEAHAAIQDLAKNPLLLTIIALVHRIDAVLPDERVVLYQKCTETLLNTWHTWKFREVDVQKRGKMERRNRQRMEAIAHWMQTRPRANAGDPRAVVKKKELTAFLAGYIGKNEAIGSDEDATDLANDFIEFVRQRAGLLIEVGDNQFSFVHLTFQEYLAAAWFKTRCEKDGVEAVWKSLTGCVHDSAWHEVVRLLVASLTSDDAQEVLMRKLLQAAKRSQRGDSLDLLTAGLLLDGVAAAAARRSLILRMLLDAAAASKEAGLLRKLIVAVRACDKHDDTSRSCFDELVEGSWAAEKRDPTRMARLVTLLLAGRPVEQLALFLDKAKTVTENERLSLGLFGRGVWPKGGAGSATTSRVVRRLEAAALYEVTVSAADNVIGTSLAATLACGNSGAAVHTLFRLAGFTLFWSTGPGPSPFADFYLNLIALGRSRGADVPAELLWDARALRALERHRAVGRVPQRALVLGRAMARALTVDRARSRARILVQGRTLARIAEAGQVPELGGLGIVAADRARLRVRGLEKELVLARKLRLGRRTLLGQVLDPHGDLTDTTDMNPERVSTDESAKPKTFWNRIVEHNEFRKALASAICGLLELQPRPHVIEAVERVVLPSLPSCLPFTAHQDVAEVQQAFASGTVETQDVSGAALLLLLDSAVWILNGFERPEESLFNELADATRPSREARLRFAHCIRDLAYGKEEREQDLIEMVNKPDAEMRRVLVDICWIDDKRSSKK